MSNDHEVIVPRNFVLLEEADKAEKGGSGDPYCTFGIENMDDVLLHNWTGFIMTHPNGIVREQYLSFKIYCGDKYPDVPPEVTILEPPCKIMYNKECIFDANGKVTVPIMKSWNRSYRIFNVLKQIKNIAETNKTNFT